MQKKLGLEIKIVRKSEEIPRSEWEKIFPSDLEGYPFFKTLDESGFSQFKFYYIAIYDRTEIAGIAPCFLMDYPLDLAIQGTLEKFLRLIKKPFPNIFKVKTLLLGLPMNQGRIGLNRDANEVVAAICLGMEQIACKEKASLIAFKDFSSHYCKILDPLLKKGFSKIQSLPSTDMDIPFASFEEYLQKLSPVSRSGVKRKFKKIDSQQPQVKMEIVDSLSQSDIPRVYELYLQTLEKHSLGFENVPKEFFLNISRNMPAQTKFFLWRLEDKLVAFAFCLVSPELFIDYYLGFDYQIAFNYHLYFIRFRDLMKWCIEHKIPKYEMGVTGYEPKRRLGFDFVPLFIYARSRNKWLNRFFKIICLVFKPENFNPVFKQMEESENKKRRPQEGGALPKDTGRINHS